LTERSFSEPPPLPDRAWVRAATPPGYRRRAFHLQTGKIYGRFVEIVETFAAGSFFYAPDRALQGSRGTWPTRASLKRRQQYGGSYPAVRYFSPRDSGCSTTSSAVRDRGAHGRREGQPIAISPDRGVTAIPYRPG